MSRVLVRELFFSRRRRSLGKLDILHNVDVFLRHVVYLEAHTSWFVGVVSDVG